MLMVPLILYALLPALATERPPIVGIANFVVKTDNLEDIRKFYTGVLGYDEVFKHKRTGSSNELVVFKVNDHQYIEVSQTLSNEADDKLIQIGFETERCAQAARLSFGKGAEGSGEARQRPGWELQFCGQGSRRTQRRGGCELLRVILIRSGFTDVWLCAADASTPNKIATAGKILIVASCAVCISRVL